jgi:hypothetical protein
MWELDKRLFAGYFESSTQRRIPADHYSRSTILSYIIQTFRGPFAGSFA